MADNRRYPFDEQRESGGGKFSSALALASFILFSADVIVSLHSQGNAGSVTGVIAVVAMLLSIYGFYTGMKSFNERDVSPTFSIIGSIFSGVMMVGWLTLILIGLA